MQPREALELGAVLAPELHDPLGGAQLPQVVGGVVAQAGEPPLGGGVAQRRRVEVDAGVGEPLVGDHVGDLAVAHARVVAQDRLQVAHAHVVGDEREVLAAEALGGQLEVARGGGERLVGVEALVDAAALRPPARRARRAPAALGPGDAAGGAAACGHVDVHVQQALAGLGHDLREPGGALGPHRGQGVVAPAALEEDEPLQRGGLDAGPPGGAGDLRAAARHALGGGHGAARRERVQRVARARGRALDQLLVSARRPGEGILDRLGGCLGGLAGRRRDDRDVARGRVAAAAEQGEGQSGGRQHDDRDEDETRRPARRGRATSLCCSGHVLLAKHTLRQALIRLAVLWRCDARAPVRIEF